MINFIDCLEIKMSKKKGGGMFATRDINKDELLIIEKPIAYIKLKYEAAHIETFYKEESYSKYMNQLVQKCI